MALEECQLSLSYLREAEDSHEPPSSRTDVVLESPVSMRALLKQMEGAEKGKTGKGSTGGRGAAVAGKFGPA